MGVDALGEGGVSCCLLLTLFHRHMRPLLDAGRVFAAVPPLHRIEVPAAGKQPREAIYTYSDAEMKAVTAQLRSAGRRVKEPVQRYKGLGEMDAKQLRETTMDPASRTLRRMQVGDAEAAADVFDLLMGSDVDPASSSCSREPQHLTAAASMRRGISTGGSTPER